ncbi:MAG: glycine cleavage system protein H, partial [Candidatus Dormibacteria bacterium]
SVKAASDVYSPVAGEVVAVNEAVAGAPELVNRDAQGKGWLVRVRVDGDLPGDLLEAAQYDSFAQADSH